MTLTRIILPVFMLALIARSTFAQDQPVTPHPKADFLQAARTVTASIQKSLYNDKTGLYFQSEGKHDPEFMWGNGVMFSALVAAARHDPTTYRPILDRFFTAMDRYWDAKAKIPGYEPAPTAGNGHDKYYDDNEWMVITFLEAYDLTHDDRYLKRAKETLAFSLSGWDDTLGGGIWWHEKHKGDSKNTCANAPAAVACLRLARHANPQENIDWARKLVKWTTEHLQDEGGLFFDNQRATDKHVDRTKYTYNTALMIRANAGLYRATNEPAFLTEAKRISAAANAFTDKKTGAYRDSPRFSHLLIESDLELYRLTHDDALLDRARRNGEIMWSRWQSSPPKELIEQAAIARGLWLLADHDTETGREFWKQSDSTK
jgi:hypothetical protein